MAGGWTGTDTTRTTAPEHRAWRTAVLERDDYLCQILGGRCTRIATEADHIRETSDGGALYDLANGQAVCSKCHAQKTAAHANRVRWANRGNYDEGTHPGLR